MTKLRLNDMQLVLLASAAQRDDGHFMPLPDCVSDQASRAKNALQQLINKGLAEQINVASKDAAWREDGEILTGAIITGAGRAAINAEEQSDVVAQQEQAPPAECPPPPAVGKTKRSTLIDMLNQEGGATLDQMVNALSWLPHTTRAALTGLRKSGLNVLSDKVDGTRRYRIAERD